MNLENLEVARRHVINFINEYYDDEFEVSDGRYDENEEYTRMDCMIFVISYGKGENELVHVVKIARGYQLMNASARNWNPSQDNCLAYEFIPNKLWNP